jgi:catechol 2,3-dioxygenase-like lactoylglutathione lyase family enzyme
MAMETGGRTWADTMLRVARPTEQLERVVRFYVDGLGLSVLDCFEGHEGFDGVMVGLPGAPFHLEFTQRKGRQVGLAPTEDHLLVFYMPDHETWQASVDRMQAAGCRAVASSNPYWDRAGVTFEDPDGYRIVLENSEWSP